MYSFFLIETGLPFMNRHALLEARLYAYLIRL